MCIILLLYIYLYIFAETSNITVQILLKYQTEAAEIFVFSPGNWLHSGILTVLFEVLLKKHYWADFTHTIKQHLLHASPSVWKQRRPLCLQHFGCWTWILKMLLIKRCDIVSSQQCRWHCQQTRCNDCETAETPTACWDTLHYRPCGPEYAEQEYADLDGWMDECTATAHSGQHDIKPIGYQGNCKPVTKLPKMNKHKCHNPINSLITIAEAFILSHFARWS